MILNNIKIKQDLEIEKVIEIALKKYKINKDNIKSYKIARKSIDARNKNDIYYNYSIDFELKDEKKEYKSKEHHNQEEKIKTRRNSNLNPIIIGFGPAGIFAALTLINNGIKPIIIEQGETVNDRKKTVDKFIKEGKLNPMSNVQFGEGGAGTFSDGKLTTGINNPLCKKVLSEFVKYGAPKEIEYINKPHIGTDNLILIIENIRKYIISKGGKFLFNTKLINFTITENKIKNIKCKTLNNEEINLETDSLVLAIGHSSRDTIEMLYANKITMEKKNFSVGLRIEHKQSQINKSQYGEKTKLKLPPADYKLVYHGKTRDCYTFCMCPGGEVIASSSEPNTIVTNGMSEYKRNGENANSAILVNISTTDFNGDSPLEGIYFQKDLEEKAFKLGGRNYYAPIQRLEDFMNDRKSTYVGEVKPTYKPGTTLSNLQEILPEFVTNTIKEAIPYFDKRIKGFANKDSIMTGIETRSSSPITIKRNEKLMSNIYGIYPCGEGAGYAGGIMSAAVDGIKVAIKILEEK